MSNKKDSLNQEDFDYSEGAGRIARFKATRAIHDASKQIRLGSDAPKKMMVACILPRNVIPPKLPD